MGRIAAAVCLLFLMVLPVLACADATAVQAQKLALAQKYYEVAGIEKVYGNKAQMEAMLDGQMLQMEKNLAQRVHPDQVEELHQVLARVRPGLSATVARTMEQMQPDLVRVIARTYSDRELQALIAFDSTPEGRAIVAKTPAVYAEMTNVSAQYTAVMMRDLQQRVVKVLQEAAAASDKKKAGQKDGT